jgi:pimeloyl-ACP methyl ester carboxylesterase
MTFSAKFQFATIGGGHRMAFYRAGSGEPMLLVHGITTYSFIWRKVMPLLIDKYDVVAVDLLGCGDSDKPLDRSYSLASHAGYLKEFLDAIGISKVHFVGHDLGGGMGQIFAVRYPEMLHDLTMINTVAHDFWPVQPIIAMRTPIVRQLMMAAVDAGAFKMIVKRGLYHKDRLTTELMDLFMKPMRTPDGRKAFLHYARCLDNKNLTEIEKDLRKLTMPVLIIRGDGDVYLSSAISERLYKEIPGSKLARIATGGHFIQEDEPEQIAQLITEFIERRHAK